MSSTHSTSGHDERRRHKRARLFSVSYLHLANGTGGLILNIAQEGMAIRAEIPNSKYLRDVRFSIPSTPHYIVCDAEVLWFDGRRKTAGLHLTALSTSDRDKIRSWILSQEKPQSAAVACPPTIVETATTFDFAAFFPPESNAPTESSSSAPAPYIDHASSPVVHPLADGPAPPSPVLPLDPNPIVSDNVPRVSVTDPRGMVALDQNSTALPISPSNSDARDARDLQHEVPLDILRKEVFSAAQTRSSPQMRASPPSNRRMRPALIAAGGFLVGLSCATAFMLGALPIGHSRPPLPSGKTTTAKLNIQQQSHSADQYSIPKSSTPLPSPGRDTDQIVSESLGLQPAPAGTQIHSAPKPVTSTPPELQQDTLKSQPVPALAHQSNSTVTSATAPRSSPAEILLSTSAASTQLPTSYIPNSSAPVPNVEAPPNTRDVNETKVTTSVQSSSQFSAIHMPNGDATPISGDLQIGPLISDRQPDYPAPAAQAGIQGTVKLHATVGTDGNVERVEPVSGPSELIHPAMAAVQNWQFGPTILAGKPVESERNITFVFRVMN